MVNLVSFLIIFWILKKFVFGPITRVIKERREKISAGLSNADLAEATLLAAEKEAADFKQAAQQEAHGIVAESKGRAETVAAKVVADAETKAGQLVAEAHIRGESDIAQMRQELKNEMANVVVSAVGKITKEDMSSEKQQSLVGRAAELIAQS